MKQTYTITIRSKLFWVAAVCAAVMCIDLLHLLLGKGTYGTNYASYKEYWMLAAGSGLLALMPLVVWKLPSHAGWLMLLPTGFLTVVEIFSAPKAVSSWFEFGLFCILVLLLAIRMREGSVLFWKVLAVFGVIIGLLFIFLPMWQRVYDWNAAGRLDYDGARAYVMRYFLQAICQRGLLLVSFGCLIVGMKPMPRKNRLEDEQDQFDRIWE